MSKELVRRLIAANENKERATYVGDLFYLAAERIDYLERTLAKIADPLRTMREEAEEKGCKLNEPEAVRLSQDIKWLQQVAMNALRTKTQL